MAHKPGITIKDDREIRIMREAGRIVATVLTEIGQRIRSGVTTEAMDSLAYKTIANMDAKPSFLNYRGYPATICISVNEQVVHGIPGPRALQEGDIVSVDVGAIYQGYHGDAARTFLVGEVAPETRLLVERTQACYQAGCAQAFPGNRIGDISHAVQTLAESFGYGVVRELIGHGVGQAMHEEPDVPNFGLPGRGPLLQAGMVIAIEPMINLGTHRVHTLEDAWTVVTSDGKPSAHYENTVYISPDGPVELTVL